MPLVDSVVHLWSQATHLIASLPRQIIGSDCNTADRPQTMQPKLRNYFEIAVICALPLEFDAVEATFDEFYHDDEQLLRQQSGGNWYRLGRIGLHNIVLACLSGVGKGSAAGAASRLQASFDQVELALVVGVCGAVPFVSETQEILLGDVIISNSIVEYDMGKRYPDMFMPKGYAKETLGGYNRDLRAFLSGLQTRSMGRQIQDDLLKNLRILQNDMETSSQYPGSSNDKLFEASYRHKHYGRSVATTACICVDCDSATMPVCNDALESDCTLLGCNGDEISRQRLSGGSEPRPMVYFGAVASGDTVMKSGEHRDYLAKNDKVIGFEMEGAGVLDSLPCIVIKGVSDYADSHKNKKWQRYAAATAASCMKAFLGRYNKVANATPSEESQLQVLPVEAELPISRPQERHLCGCICHKKYRFNTPKSLINWLGAVFVAHSGVPGMTQACNDPYCLKPAAMFGYFNISWPIWLSKSVTSFAFSQTPSPEFLMRVATIRPAGHDVFHYAADGNVSGLQSLFNKGSASPFDISANRGRSLLRVAVSFNQMDVCEFLISKHADPFLEDHNHVCAFDLAWDKILAKRVSGDEESRLRALFPWRDHLEDRGFSKLHKAVLDILYVDLNQELELCSRAAINRQDETGMTPISWAAWRGDIDTTRLLIKYGSDTNLANKKQMTPLHYASTHGNADLISLLLSAGASVHSLDRDQTTPLHRLILSRDSPDILQTMIQSGAVIDSSNKIGATPLMCAVQIRRPESAKLLLASGANVNKKDCQGWSVLQQAIFFNSHECIKHILKYPIDWTNLTAEGESIIHIIAEDADIQTMHLLLSHPLPRCFPIDHTQNNGQTASDIAAKREMGAEWQSVFANILCCMAYETMADLPTEFEEKILEVVGL